MGKKKNKTESESEKNNKKIAKEIVRALFSGNNNTVSSSTHNLLPQGSSYHSDYPSLTSSTTRVVIGENKNSDSVINDSGTSVSAQVYLGSHSYADLLKKLSQGASGAYGLVSDSNNNLKKNESSDPESSSQPHQDVSSSGSDFQRLNTRVSESALNAQSSEHNSSVRLSHIPPFNFGTLSDAGALLARVQSSEHNCAVLFPWTLRNLADDGSNTSTSGLEENAAAVSSSSAQYLGESSANHGDEQPGFDDQDNDLFQPERDAERHYYHLPKDLFDTEPSVSDLSFQNSRQTIPLMSPGMESENLPNFQSEVIRRFGNLAPRQRFARPQDTMAQSSSAHLEQLADPRGHCSHTQNQPHRTTISQQPLQAFPGSAACYNQSSTDMNYDIPQNRNEFYGPRSPLREGEMDNGSLNQPSRNINYNIPQNGNEFHVHRRPPTGVAVNNGSLNCPPVIDATGHGSLHPPLYNPGAGSSQFNPPLAHDHVPSRNFNEISPPHHDGARDILGPIQQYGSFSPRNYEPRLRPESTQNGFQGQPSQDRPENHSQAVRFEEELQWQGHFQDLSSDKFNQFQPRNP